VKVLLTGSSGFLGRQLFFKLSKFYPLCVGRYQPDFVPSEQFFTYDIAGGLNQLTPFLLDVDVVIHCAARVHVMNEKSSDPLRAWGAGPELRAKRLPCMILAYDKTSVTRIFKCTVSRYLS